MESNVLSRKNIIFLFILILLLGTFLRFYNIGKNPFWFDETWSGTSVKLDSAGKVVLLALEYDEHPILQHLIFYWWGKIVGYNEGALRSLSAITGIISIIFLFLFTKRLFGDFTALIASFIFTISPAYIEYSQEFRPYMLITMITLIASYYLIKAILDKQNKYWIYTTIILVIGGNIEYLFALFIISVFVFLVFYSYKNKEQFKKVIYTGVATFLILLPNIFIALFQTSQQAWHTLILSPLWKILILPYQFYCFIFGFHSPYLNDFNINLSLFSILLLAVIFYAFITFYGLIKIRQEDKTKLILLIIILLLPILLLYLVNIFKYIQMEPKRFLFVAFPCYIIIANGISSLKNKCFFILSIIIITFVSAASLYGYYNFEKEDWPSVVKYINNNKRDGDAVGISSNALTLSFDYYNKESYSTYGIPLPYLNGFEASFFEAVKNRNIKRYNYNDGIITETNFQYLFNSSFKNYSRLWFIQTRKQTVDPKNNVVTYLNKNFELINRNNFSNNNINVYLYRLK